MPQQPFVERFEMAIMQYVILTKAKQGEVTKENLRQTFRGNLQMSKDHLDHCITTLVDDGHLQSAGGDKYRATDDGREDVQQLETIVLELPQIVGTTGGSQRGGQSMTQTPAVGGKGATPTTTGSTMGNQPNVGTSGRQGGPGNFSNEQNREKGDVPKGGATSPGGNKPR